VASSQTGRHASATGAEERAMSVVHRVILTACLGLLGLSLLIPGLLNVLRPGTGTPGLVATNADAANHVRALNGMMAAIGATALWACLDLPRARQLVLALGMLMTALVLARAYSIAVDGMPGMATRLYLAVELMFGLVFLGWAPPPPAS
jgi:hypothetical protein